MTTPSRFCSLSTQEKTLGQTKLQLPEAPGSSWGGTSWKTGWTPPHSLVLRPGERLPATDAQGLPPEQGVSGSTSYPEPEPQACLFWYTENSMPQGLSQNHLSAILQEGCGVSSVQQHLLLEIPRWHCPTSEKKTLSTGGRRSCE